MSPNSLGQGSSSHRSSRRRFLQQSALASAAALVVPPWVAPAIVRGRNLNEKLRIALIGVGGRGAANARGVASEHIVALCDVSADNLNQAATTNPQARKFADFRKLYDHANDFDAVVVSTCEHTHAFATLPALQLGKHVYCEKPLTHGIWEARVIREAAAKAKVATQMGTQVHAGNNYRRVVELIRSGAIGDVSEAHVWVSRAWGWHPSEAEAREHKDIVFLQDRPPMSEQPPAGLAWDLWLGPAPYRPFHNAYVPGPKWYRWWDFGSGTMSDLGSHFNDLPFWALDLKAPRYIEAAGSPPHAELAPASMQARYEYEAENGRPAVALTWYQGTHKPTLWTEGAIPQWTNGMLFVGSKGMLLSDYGKHVLLPEQQFKDFQPPEPSIPNSVGHYAEWIEACKTGSPTTCNFEYAGLLTEANHLGNIAYRLGKRLTWDTAALRAEGTPEADPLIRREYRKGWNLA